MTRKIKQNTSNQKERSFLHFTSPFALNPHILFFLSFPLSLSTMMEEPELQMPQVLSPCSSARRSSSDANSPEFEFWMVRNPSFPQPNLLSADELFSDGVLLPLHLLHLPSSDEPPDPNPAPSPAAESEPEPSGSDHNETEPGSTPELSSVLPVLSAPAPTSSKRWKDIFKKSDRRKSRDCIDDNQTSKEKDREKKKEKKSSGVGAGGGGNNAVSAAELNINIWPFSRSRSAGNGGSRPRLAAGTTRKVSSAPCSRSNSAGESKSRKWPSSPSRGGVHVGRNSPVWQVRRGGGAGSSGGKSVDLASKNAEKPLKKEGSECRRKTSGAMSSGGGTKGKALHLNVPMCIGYRHHLSCRSDENSAVSVATAAAAAASSSGGGGEGVDGAEKGGGSSPDEGIRGNNLFNLRSLFTKKVH